MIKKRGGARKSIRQEAGLWCRCTMSGGGTSEENNPVPPGATEHEIVSTDEENGMKVDLIHYL